MSEGVREEERLPPINMIGVGGSGVTEGVNGVPGVSTISTISPSVPHNLQQQQQQLPIGLPQSTQASHSTHSSQAATKARNRNPSANGPTVASQADDEKYVNKFREMKFKTRGVMRENDSLYLKLLKTQWSIKRAKLFRAILYERLQDVKDKEVDKDDTNDV